MLTTKHSNSKPFSHLPMNTVKIHCQVTNEFEKKVREELYYSGEHADVEFVIGKIEKRTFKAHRLILMTGSHKFRKMLELHKSKDPIIIPEFDPDIFQQLLKGIYLHRFELDSIVTALKCKQIFQEFDIPPAVQQCNLYLSNPSNINCNDAITVFELNPQNKDCLEIFANNTRDVLTSVAFSRARLSTILTIFSLPELNIATELDLLDALFQYAQMHGALPGHNTDGNDERFKELVQPAISKIRFMTLNPVDFMGSEAVRALLSDQQIVNIVGNLLVANSEWYPLPKDICPIKESRIIDNDQSRLRFGDVDMTTESSVEVLADTAEINSQMSVTPSTPMTSKNHNSSSIDWTTSKMQGLNMNDSNGKKDNETSEEIIVEPDMPIGSSTMDSSSIVEILEEDQTLTDDNKSTSLIANTQSTPGEPSLFKSIQSPKPPIISVWPKNKIPEFTPAKNGNGYSPVKPAKKVVTIQPPVGTKIQASGAPSIKQNVESRVPSKGKCHPKFRMRNYLERQSKKIAEENMEKCLPKRKRGRNSRENWLPLKKRNVKNQETKNEKLVPNVVIQKLEPPEETTIQIEAQPSEMTDEEMLNYLVMHQVKGGLLWNMSVHQI
uniref:CSON007439 protein n=1 Tax=Culicoides sonorensis TaxID=179676 RepID=A0A336M9K0_CULSO